MHIKYIQIDMDFYEEVDYDITKPCPPGYYRKINNKCALITKDEQLDEIIYNRFNTTKKRCLKGYTKNQLGDCILNQIKSSPKKNRRTQRKSPVKKQQLITLEEVTQNANELLASNPNIKIQKPTMLHLFQFINNQHPDELRRRNEDVMLPFERYTDDKSLLLYLLNEIIELSIHFTRDSNKKIVTISNIQKVIQNDDQLRQLFD
jgi:hypothetical protein